MRSSQLNWPTSLLIGWPHETGDNYFDTRRLDDLEKIARVLGVTVLDLFLSPGRTAAERVILGLLEGEGYK